MNNKSLVHIITILLTFTTFVSKISAQREGGLPRGSIINQILISNGPKGPIYGGESAVTDMILMEDGWVYGSTMATGGADRCHLFRTDSEKIEHLINVTSILPNQTSISDIALGPKSIIFGCTSTYNEIFDDKNNTYKGGHLFSFTPETKKLEDFGVISNGQGINCLAVDAIHSRIYCVTYPAGRLFAYNYDTKSIKDFGEIMTPWKVKDFGKVSWRGVPKVLIIDNAGTVYFSTYYRSEVKVDKKELMKGGFTAYSSLNGGRIYRVAYGDDKPTFTGAIVPTQTGMDSDPIYENGIASALRAQEGGFWCGTINDGFLFKFHPSTSTVINKGKPFQYWNLKSLTYGKNGKLYMLGGRNEDNSWILSYDPATGSIDCLGWLDPTTQCSVICADKEGKILIAENLRHSFIWVCNLR